MGGEITVTSNGKPFADAPAITALHDGTYAIVWANYVTSLTPGETASDLRGQIFAASAKDGGAGLRVTHTSANEAAIAWAPDSRRIAYVSEPAFDGAFVESVLAAGGGSRRLSAKLPHGSFGPSFAPDGRRIALTIQRPDAAAPNILPRLGLARAEIHGGRVGPRQIVRIEPGGHQARLQIVAVHTGDEVGIDDAAGAALHDGLLIRRVGICLRGGDERGADIAQIRPHRLRRQHGAARRDGARQRHRAIEPGTDFLDQRKGRQRSGMPPGPGRHRHQPIRTLFDSLTCKPVIDHVMHDDAAIGVHGSIHLRTRSE